MFEAGKVWSFIMTIFLLYILFSQVPLQAKKFEKKNMQFSMKEEIAEYESTDDNYPYPVTNIGHYSFNGPLYKGNLTFY